MNWIGRFESVVKRLRDAAGRESGRAKAPAAPTRHLLAQQQFRVSADIEGKLANLIHRNDQSAAGRVYLVSLEKVMAHLAATGQHAAEKCFYVAERVIRLHLAEGDFYARYRDSGYLVVFANLSAEAAQLKCALISRTIAEHLVGAALARELCDSRSVTGDSGKKLRFAELPPVEQLGFASPAAPEPAPAHSSAGDWSYDTLGPEFESQVLRRMSFSFSPMCSVRSGKAGNYLWTPGRMDEAGAFFKGHDAVLDSNSPAQIRELDLFSLNAFRRRLDGAARGDEPYLVTFPVHFETLASMKGRGLFIQACQEMARELQRRTVFELVGLPDGIFGSRLVEIVALVRPFCRSVLARLPIEFIALPDLRFVDLFALGADLEHDGRRTENEMANMMIEFSLKVHRLGLKAYVLGVETPRLLQTAAEAGYEHIAGRFLLPAVPLPKGLVEVNLEYRI